LPSVSVISVIWRRRSWTLAILMSVIGLLSGSAVICIVISAGMLTIRIRLIVLLILLVWIVVLLAVWIRLIVLLILLVWIIVMLAVWTILSMNRRKLSSIHRVRIW